MSKLVFRMSALIIISTLMAACGASDGGQQAADLAATQQSLEATQAELAAQQAAPTDPPEATSAPAIPPTEASTEIPVVEAEAYYTEEFSETAVNWTYELLSGQDADLGLFSDHGRLVFDIQGEYVWPYLTYASYSYTDVRVDARAENLGNNNNSVILICRYNDRGWYEFNVSNSGLYWIFRYERSTGDFIQLYSGGVQNLNTGKATNDYTIICQGDRLTLAINGEEVRTVEDSQFDEGLVGISVSSFDLVPVLVEVDFVTISQP